MIQPLEKHQYDRVIPLFKGQHLSLVIEAVAAGNSPALLWVDNLDRPKTALMWDKAHSIYLVGSAEKPDLNGSLSKLFAERLMPEAAARHLTIFKIYYTSRDWEKELEGIFPDLALTKLERSFYRLTEQKACDWRAHIPAGYQIHQIDKNLLSRKKLKQLPNVISEIESGWVTVARFLEKGFGFCMVRDEAEIVSWCTAEYISGRKCGVGVETVAEYTNQGFATLTASAFVEHSLSFQITPYWDAWKGNAPSLTLAEKVGFQKVMDYTVYLCRVNRT